MADVAAVDVGAEKQVAEIGGDDELFDLPEVVVDELFIGVGFLIEKLLFFELNKE